MSDLLRFALLGLGTGGIYALLGLGLVVIYRGSGVINFAQAGFALVGAYLTYRFQVVDGHGMFVSWWRRRHLLRRLGVAVHWLVMRPLRTASPLARVIATLGVLTVLTQAVVLEFGAKQVIAESPVPTEALTLPGDIVVGRYGFYLVAIAAAVALLLTVTSARTRFGYAISGGSRERPRRLGARLVPRRARQHHLGGRRRAGGRGGGLMPATTSGFISPITFSILIIGALATALLGGFKSYPLALVGGVFLGVAQFLAQHLSTTTSPPSTVQGVPDAVPFLVIIVVLVIRGRGLPLRGSLTDRLPRVGTGRVRPVSWSCSAAAALLWIAFGAVEGLVRATVVSATFAIVGLSVVVLTGYTGQLSLAQFALAGIGSFAAPSWSRSTAGGSSRRWSSGSSSRRRSASCSASPRCAPAASTSPSSPSGSASPCTSWSSATPPTPSPPGVQPTDLSLFGGRSTRSGTPATTRCLRRFLILAALAVANLRRGRAGRRLLAVRTNERAAAAIGVNVFETKLYGFTLVGRHRRARRGPVRLRLRRDPLDRVFQPGTSISVLVLTVIGSAGYVAGPLLGSLLATNGLITLTSSGDPVNAAVQDTSTLAGVPPHRHRRPAARRADPQPERRLRAAGRPHPPVP